MNPIDSIKMASTIVAEDECNQIIMNPQDPIKIASTTIVEDESNQIVNKTNENNTEQQVEKPNPIDVEIIEILSEEESQDSEYSSNVIILGTKENQSTENPDDEVRYTVHDEDYDSEEDGNTSQEEDNSSHDEGNVTVLGEGRPKSKRRMKSELERLLLDTKMRPDGIEEDYDGFGDESTIFRKYKLRKSEQTVSYKEPADIKPKRRNDDDERDLTCPVCKEDCDTMVTLHHHLRTHNRSIHGYTCSLCSEKFDRNAHLIAHRQKHTEDSFLCQECKLTFSIYSEYLLHNYEHINQPYFKCLECGLHHRKAVYKQHIMTHFETKLSCDLCSFTTNNAYNLQTHLYEHNNKLTCVECGKLCHNNAHLDRHMTLHTGVKKLQCLYCGLCFRTKSSREIHTRTHTGEKPFPCEICGFKALQWRDYARHIEAHMERKYECDLCGDKFTHKYNLISHLRSHAKKSLGGDKSHSKSKHRRERPDECLVCHRKFANYKQYKKHCKAKYHLRNVYGYSLSTETRE